MEDLVQILIVWQASIPTDPRVRAAAVAASADGAILSEVARLGSQVNNGGKGEIARARSRQNPAFQLQKLPS